MSDFNRLKRAMWEREKSREKVGVLNFPDLKWDSFTVASGETEVYNCIANVLGILHEWIWPENDSFDELFEKHGYERVEGIDLSVDPECDKIILYEKVTWNNCLEPVHAIKQNVNGTWSSKNGEEECIHINSPYDIAGGCYGQPMRMYVRRQM
jgi:hypothetical protein